MSEMRSQRPDLLPAVEGSSIGIIPNSVSGRELESVGVLASTELKLNAPHRVKLDRGTIALDGERELEFGTGDTITVTLAQDGPCVIGVPAVLATPAAAWPTT